MEKVKGLGSICKSEKSLKSGRGEEEEKKTPMEKYSFKKKVTKMVGWLVPCIWKKKKETQRRKYSFQKMENKRLACIWKVEKS